MTALDLADRVENLTGPDRDVDRLICIATAVICDSIDPTKVQNLTASPTDDGWVHYEYNGDYYTDAVRAFTASIDAAMTLVPEGFAWTLATHGIKSFNFWCSISFPDEECESYQAVAMTPALALTVAALRARAKDAGNR